MSRTAFEETLKQKKSAEIYYYIAKFNEKIDYYTNILNDENLMQEKGLCSITVRHQIVITEEKKMMCVRELEARNELSLN